MKNIKYIKYIMVYLQSKGLLQVSSNGFDDVFKLFV